MKPLFNYIKARINSRVPQILTVRMWNNQFARMNDNTQTGVSTKPTKGPIERPVRYPCCFVEFEIVETYNRCLKIKDYLLTVRFRFGIEAYKLERLETFDFCDAFTAAIQSMSPTGASGLSFTSFDEITTNFDEDYSNVENPVREYRTVYRDLSGYYTPVVSVTNPTLQVDNVATTS